MSDYQESPEHVEAPDASQSEKLSPKGIAAMQGDAPRDVWIDRGMQDVPVADLPNPDGVAGPADFDHHISWDDAQSAAKQLPDIQRQVQAGKTADDISAADQAASLDYAHGQRRVYDLYYGSDPVSLEKDGNRYDIISGRHRVYAAKAAGLESIPARVMERQSG